jgi:hypothetical protein
VYLETPTFTFDPDSIFTTHIADFDFAKNQLAYLTNVIDHRDRLTDLAAIYRHINQAVAFTRQLGAAIRPLVVNAYAPQGRGVYYEPTRSAIVIDDRNSDYDNGNRPMNREWHETFHALMQDTIGIPSTACTPSSNHGGWANCSTSDSWSEGWAEFWTTVLWEQLGGEHPELYRLGFNNVRGSVSLEDNWDVWDRACNQPWCPSREEFAVASLLRDLYDPILPTEDDYVTVPLSQLWNIMSTTSIVSPRRDLKDLYDALVAAGIGQSKSINRVCSLNDLQQIFVLHGVYYDTSHDRHYDCGEEIGRAADIGRSNRRDAPLVDAYLSTDFLGLPPDAAVVMTVTTTFEGASYLDYSYSVELTQTGNSLLYLEPPPTRTLAIISMWAQSGEYHSSNPLTMTNAAYWDMVRQAPTAGSIIITHTNQMVRKPPLLIDVRPLSMTNETWHGLTVTADAVELGVQAWVGSNRLVNATRINSTTLQAIVPAGLAPGNYKVRVANPSTAIAVYTDTLAVSNPPSARNVIRLTRGLGKPGDIVHIFVDANTLDEVAGGQIEINYPSSLTFLEPVQLTYRSQYLEASYNLPQPGHLVILFANPKSISIPAGVGPLARLTFRINADNATGLTIPLNFFAANTVLSDRNGNEIAMTRIANEVEICAVCSLGIWRGDATGDGSVNVLDYYRVLGIILGTISPSSAEQWAADANGDGNINILDVIPIVNWILSGQTRQLTALALNATEPLTLTIPPMPMAYSSVITVPLQLVNQVGVAGFEATISFSDTLSLSNILATSRSANLSLQPVMGAPGTAKFVLSSLAGKTIMPGSGSIINLVFATTPEALPGSIIVNEVIAGDSLGIALPVNVVYIPNWKIYLPIILRW